MRLARGASIETSTRNLEEIDGYAGAAPGGHRRLRGMAPGNAVSPSGERREAAAPGGPEPGAAYRRAPARETRRGARVPRAAARRGAGDARAPHRRRRRRPVGPFDSSLALLGTGLLEAHGIRAIGIAGYPKASRGSPTRRSRPRAIEARSRRRTARRLHRDAVLLRRRARSSGGRACARAASTDPVRIGVAGIATSARCSTTRGAAASAARSARSAPSRSRCPPDRAAGPEEMVARSPPRRARRRGPALFPFGGFAHTANWLQTVAAGCGCRSTVELHPRRHDGAGSAEPRRRKVHVHPSPSVEEDESDHVRAHHAAVSRRPCRQLPASEELLDAREQRCRARSPAPTSRTPRTPRSATSSSSRRTSACRASPTASSAAPTSTSTFSSSLPESRPGRHHRQVPQQARRRDFAPPVMHVTGGAPRAADPARRFRFLRRSRSARPR